MADQAPKRRPASRSGLTRAVGACSPAELHSQTLVGGVALLIGLFILAAASGVFGPLSGLRAPVWVLGLAGAVFLMVGLVALQTVAGQHYRQYRLRRLAAQYPEQAELKDYPWDLAGSRAGRWLPTLRWTTFTFLLTLFAALGTWALFSPNTPPLPFQVIFWLFNVLVLAMWIFSMRAFWRALRFRPGFLFWPTFPLRPEGEMTLSWQPPPGLNAWSGGTAKLQCLEETRTASASSRKQRNHPVHLIRWEEEIPIAARNEAGPRDAISLTFHPAPDLPGSSIGSGPPVIFWELEIELQVPGVNPGESHLIPVYRESSAS